MVLSETSSLGGGGECTRSAQYVYFIKQGGEAADAVTSRRVRIRASRTVATLVTDQNCARAATCY